MRKVLLIILAAAAAGCMRDPGPESAGSGLRTANAAFERALIAGDAATLASLYTADSTMIGDGATIRGKAGPMRGIAPDIDLIEARSENVRIIGLGTNAAVMTGRYSGRYRTGGKDHMFAERFTSVWVNEEGKWKIRHEHASLIDKPRPEPQPQPKPTPAIR